MAENWLWASVVAALCVVLPVAALGLAGILGTFSLILVTGALGLWASRLEEPQSPSIPWQNLRGLGWPLALTALVVGLDLLTHLPSPPVSWDAMTYHLYFPARWLQEGRLFHVPTVFSDNAAAFAPQNGALFFAWQMALSRRDALIDVAQLFVLGILALALYLLCRRLAIGRQPAALAALTLAWLPPIRLWTWSANVDVFMIAFWLASLYWQLRYWRRPAGATLAAAGLAGGLAAGTKALGLPLVTMTLLPLVWVLVRRARFRHFGLLAVTTVIGGGWWYLRNLWLYGNPLFPLEISVGGWTLAGAYDGAAVRAGEFHLPAAGAVMRTVVAQFGAGTCSLMVLGIVILGAVALRGALPRARHRRRIVGAAGLVVTLAVAWTGFFVFVVPHNDQPRFLIPALVLSLVGWALVLRWAGRRGRWEMLGLWAAGVVAATASAPPWKAWTARLSALSSADVDAGGWALAALSCALAAAAAFYLCRRARRRFAASALALLGGIALAAVVALAGVHSDRARAAFLARADFRDWRQGYLPFNRPQAPPKALRIAYTGANVPYALMGSGWRHRVVYVNTQGQADDGFYDFWRREPRQYLYHKPGIYRGRDRYETWLEHLEAAAIELVVIFRLHWAERRYIRATDAGFPVEQVWARRHRGRFEPVFQGEAAEIYRLLPQERE